MCTQILSPVPCCPSPSFLLPLILLPKALTASRLSPLPQSSLIPFIPEAGAEDIYMLGLGASWKRTAPSIIIKSKGEAPMKQAVLSCQER